MKTFTWDITASCNFKCGYCFFTQAGWDHMQQLQGRPRTPDEVETAWRVIANHYGLCRIHITGGEPFLFPRFEETAARLGAMHELHITSNLSRPLDEFLALVPVNRVLFNATFHPLFMEADRFAAQVLKLRGAGIGCSACCLAHPLQLRELFNYRRFFGERGITLDIVEFWGAHRGTEYPAGYTAEEREYLRAVSRDKIFAAPAADAGSPETEEPAGADCAAGALYAVVGVDGNVRRCGQIADTALGNIFEGNVVLLEGKTGCKARFCKNRETRYIDE